jgi:hypothetical protein
MMGRVMRPRESSWLCCEGWDASHNTWCGQPRGSLAWVVRVRAGGRIWIPWAAASRVKAGRGGLGQAQVRGWLACGRDELVEAARGGHDDDPARPGV